MSETLLASLISGAVAIIVCLISSDAQHKKFLNDLDKKDALQAYRLEQLEKKVDKHNNVIERTYKLEKDYATLDERVKVANHRIDDLEHEHEHEHKE